MGGSKQLILMAKGDPYADGNARRAISEDSSAQRRNLSLNCKYVHSSYLLPQVRKTPVKKTMLNKELTVTAN